MLLFRRPDVAYCVQQLSNVRRIPDQHAKDVDKILLELVRKYAECFLRTSSKAPSKGSVTERLCDSSLSLLEGRRKCAQHCLADTNATAALLRELAFTPVQLNDDGSCVSVDLGTGTGVLSLGPAIAALRQGAKRVLLNIVDIDPSLLQDADSALRSIGNKVEHLPIHGDIAQGDVYKKLDVDAVRFWVSETISDGIPRLERMDDGQIKWADAGTFKSCIDPFVYVVSMLKYYVPGFFESVRSGRTAFFPDFINDHYRPGHKNALRLRTSKSHAEHGPLKTVGTDFEYLNRGIPLRW